MKKLLPIILTLLLVCVAVPYASAANVAVSPQNLSVDGVDADCDKYNIDGSNYFKLRDLAQLLSKTDSRFSISFDKQSNAVAVVSGKEYIPVGGELARGRDQSKTAVVSKQSVLIDGKAADGLSIYNIGGNNYFKLCDLGDALGFTVDYDADSNTAIVLSKGSTIVYQNAFEKLLEDVNEKRRADMASEVTFDGFEDYLQHHRGEVEITQAEIDSLMDLNHPGKATLTRAEALEDVDLYFRALHYSYGAYYYFGEENFQKAENTIRAKLSSCKTITRDQLISLMYSNLLFVRDGHFSIAGRYEPAFEKSVQYLYYYSSQSFGKDESGYYLLGESEKWYYTSCGNANAEMQPYLEKSGRVCYSLRQFCPATAAHTADSITLTKGAETKTVSVTWSLSQSYLEDGSQVPDYHYLKSNGIALITIRRFDWNREDTMNEFVRTGSDLKSAKLIIIDARSNSGGDDHFVTEWLKNYTGEKPEQKTIVSNWGTAMYKNSGVGSKLGEEFAVFKTGDKDYELFQGKLLANSTPILLLTDSMSGSAGESIVTYCRTLDNCLVIGSPTRGAQLVGNVRGWMLPNSAIGFQFGQALHFIYSMENVEGKGYEPDLWCNPKTSLQSVLNMVERYDLGSAEGVAALRAQLPNILTK
ncbi:S41 family peptidase [Hominicoprocola fusiformis]